VGPDHRDVGVIPASADMLGAYLSWLRLQSYMPNSVNMARRVLHNFAARLEPRSLLEATRLDCEAFLGREITPGTRRVYRSRLRHFYTWAHDEELITLNPAARIPPIRVVKGLPRPISSPQLATALEAADPRMRAWLLLMALAGLRCVEVAGLRPLDVVETEGGPVLHLRITKGGKEATVPIHPALMEALAVLPIRDGAWWDCASKHVSQATGIFLRSAGVSATAHQLRHFAGTAWYKASGHDLLATARLLRHVSVDTTMGYAALDVGRTAQVVGAVPMALVTV